MSDLTERPFPFFFLILKTYPVPVSECSFALATRSEKSEVKILAGSVFLSTEYYAGTEQLRF